MSLGLAFVTPWRQGRAIVAEKGPGEVDHRGPSGPALSLGGRKNRATDPTGKRVMSRLHGAFEKGIAGGRGDGTWASDGVSARAPSVRF
jgi:hypothetical protein